MGSERAPARVLPRLVVLSLFTAVGLAALGPSSIFAAELSPKTVDAFNRYVAAAEARMKQEENQPNDFLYIENLPKPEYDSVMSMLKRGEVYVRQVRARDAKGDAIEVPGGMIHHWVGDVMIPARTVAQALQVLRDYDDFKNIYKPEVIRSRLINRKDDDDYSVYLRLQKKSIVTVTLDTWYDIHFTPVGNDSGLSRSVATRIQQVEEAGTPQEYLDPVGRDSGYLWRINSYWRYQQRKEGVVIEWESIALSRQVPFLVAWFVKPLIRNIAREAVQDMLTATRRAVLTQKPPHTKAVTTPHHSKSGARYLGPGWELPGRVKGGRSAPGITFSSEKSPQLKHCYLRGSLDKLLDELSAGLLPACEELPRAGCQSPCSGEYPFIRSSFS